MKQRRWIILLSLVLATTGSVVPSDSASERPSAESKRAGFFRVERSASGHWRLRDPRGRPFFLRGLNHYGDGTHMPWNVRERHGDAAGWRRSLPRRLREWGFNYLPPSIGPSAVDPRTLPPKERQLRNKRVTRTPEWPPEHFAELDFPFTIFLEYPRQYMAGRNLPDVFSEEFRKAVDARCREVCEPLADNPSLIGYHFCQNPPWHPHAKSFNQWIDDIVKPGSAAMKRWIHLMRRVYGTIERWRKVYGYPIRSWDEINGLEQPLRGYIAHDRMLKDRETFMRLICREWYRVYHDAVRRYDSHHLIFGDRNTLHLQPLPAFAIQEMKPFVDVLSVNVMGPPDTVYGVLEQVTRHWDGPIHLADTGAGIYAGEPAKAAYTSRDLAEFESIYSGLGKMTREHPQIIGFGWCGFYETPHPGGRSGLVDCATGEPIAERLAVMRRANATLARAEREESALEKRVDLAAVFAKRGFDPAQITLPKPGAAFPIDALREVRFETAAKFELFPEGPSYRPSDDSWFFSGNLALTRIDAKGKRHVLLEKPGGGGTHVLPDGSVLVIGATGLRRVYPDGRIALLADGAKTGKGNDLTLGIHREVYFSVPKSGIYRLNPGPDGSLERVVEKGCNGLDVDPAGEYLYTVRRNVERYRIPGPGAPLGELETVFELPKGKGGGDGCTFDAWGNFYTVHFRTGMIRVIDPEARKLLAEISTGVKPATNLTFGGPHNTELFVTAGAPKFENCQVLIADLGITGFCGHAGAAQYREIRLLPETVDAATFSGGRR